MLQSIKELYGHELAASDGEIGHVKDFYFDDHRWAVRYVIADTGSWLAKRQVLISPHAFGSLHQSGKLLVVNLTRKQIENCPSIESHKPVSRQYEEEYHQYFGWPGYWQGDGLWGSSGLPIMPLPSKPLAKEQALPAGSQAKNAGAHLRSAQAVNGYHFKASDGIIGHVCDFKMDVQTWAVPQLVVKIGNRFAGKEVQVPTALVERISYEESTVFVNLTIEAIEQSDAHPLVSVGAGE